FALVGVTWNPTRYNYVQWVLGQWERADQGGSTLWPLVALAGVVLLMGWIFFLRTAASSLGALGIVLLVGLSTVVLWILVYYDVVSTASTTLISWIVIVLFSGILAAGMSWAHLRNRWSGQASVDDVDAR